MPDTATPGMTATAAETSSASARILGFILGGGGAIVDKVFDVAYFLKKNSTGMFYALGRGSAPSLAAESAAVEIHTSVTTALGIGGSDASPYALWLQGMQRNPGYAGASFPISLNPLGGNVGVGEIVPGAKLHVKAAAEILRLETTTARGGGNNYVRLADPSGTAGFIGWTAANSNFSILNSLNGHVIVATNGVNRWLFTSTGSYEPDADNSYDIGRSGARVKVMFAATGTINTSDEREKTWRGAMTADELSAAKRIAAELGFYQWNDAIAEKGPDGARLHFGVRAQAVWAIMADEGLIEPVIEGVAPDSKYAFLCWDEWEAISPVEAVQEVRDEDDNIIVDARPAQPGRDAGDRFGIREAQLYGFLVAAQEARLAALEAAA